MLHPKACAQACLLGATSLYKAKKQRWKSPIYLPPPSVLDVSHRAVQQKFDLSQRFGTQTMHFVGHRPLVFFSSYLWSRARHNNRSDSPPSVKIHTIRVLHNGSCQWSVGYIKPWSIPIFFQGFFKRFFAWIQYQTLLEKRKQ